MKTLRILRRFAVEMLASAPRQAAASALLLAATSVTEGAGLLLLMPLLSLAGMAPVNTMPKVSGWLEATFRSVGLEPTLAAVLTLFVGIAGARVLLQRWQTRLTASVRESFIVGMRLRVYRAVANAEWSFLATRKPAEFVHVLSGEIGGLGSAATQLIELAVLAVVCLIYIGLAVHLSPEVTALVLVCAGVMGWAVRGSIEQARNTGARATAANRRMHGAIAEHMASMKTARSYGAIDRHTKHFIQLSEDSQVLSLERTAEEGALQANLEFGSTVIIGLIVFVSLEVIHVELASMLVLVFAFGRLMPRLATIYHRTQILAGVLPLFESVGQMEQECLAAAEPTPGPVAATSIPLRRNIHFQRVSFWYPRRPDSPAVRDVYLDIAVGMTTAIVGPSGAGKSTVADLLMGLLSPTEGRIVIDGVPLDRARLTDWREQISYVPQDTFLYHDTVRANLAWARPGANDADIWEALHLAAAESFVAGLPQGLDTVLGDRGILVSGGERQRLSLARALLRRPRVLILDEATSSLDSENEERIQEAIDSLHRQMTIVIITHRLSTIRHADVIHVVDAGRLVESGGWNDLLERPAGRFRQLCEAQGLVDGLPVALAPVHH